MLAEDLARLSIFRDCSPEHLEAIAPLFRPVRFPAGAKAFSEGDLATLIYVLRSGDVVIQFRPSDGGYLDIGHIQPGGVFGWSAALGRPIYTSSAICLTEVKAVAARGDDLRRVMLADPELGEVLIERMAEVVVSRLEGLRGQLKALLRADGGK